MREEDESWWWCGGWGRGADLTLREVMENRAFIKQNQNNPFSLSLSPFFKISCPGVFLPDKHDVFLGVYLLNQYLETDCFPSMFPIMIQRSMRFEKVILTFSLLNREIQILLFEDHLLVLIKNTVCKFCFKKLHEGTSAQCRTIVGGLALNPRSEPSSVKLVLSTLVVVFYSWNSHGIF